MDESGQQADGDEKKLRSTSTSLIINDAMRDPWTIIYSFLLDYAPVRASCRFLHQSFEHTLYMETVLNGLFLSHFQHPDREFPVYKSTAAQLGSLFQTKHGKPVPKRCQRIGTVKLWNIETVVELGNGWMHMLDHATNCSVSNLPNLNFVGDFWMSWCPTLEAATFTHLPALEYVGSEWLANCAKLKHLKLESLHRLLSIKDGWLAASGLVTLHIDDLPRLASIGIQGISGCDHLKRVRLELPKLKHIGNQFLSNNRVLEEVLLDLDSLEAVGGYCLMQAPLLKVIKLSSGLVARLDSRKAKFDSNGLLYDSASKISIKVLNDEVTPVSEKVRNLFKSTGNSSHSSGGGCIIC